jgi:dTDP-4-dehydrorhamnose reductase
MILVTGAGGQLGKEVTTFLTGKGIEYVGVNREELDITDTNAVKDCFKTYQPTIVFHCAAYTAVDNAEDEGKEANWSVNVDGTRNVAEAAKEHDATFIYISTDYVFDGTYKGEYTETHETNPKNEYGKAKLAGEQAVQEVLDHYYIIRTSWVFGEFGHNFVYTMQRLAKQHDKLTVVNDQMGRPTWTKTLTEFMLHLTEVKADYGIYHLSNDHQCTWYEFACEILKEEDVEVVPVTSEEFPQKAYRPPYSVMSLEKAKGTGFKIPTWKEALSQSQMLNFNK